MDTRHNKRGRPPKGVGQRKAEYLDIRLELVEKQAFKDAADLAGQDLSAWVRERLRGIARKELEGAGQAVAFLEAGTHPTKVIFAKFVRPSSLELWFADGLSGVWSFSRLKLEMDTMDLATIKASRSGNSVDVKSKWGEDVHLDSSWLRALIDPKYAAEIEKTLDALSGL